MARLERLRIFPVKGLDGLDVETAEILDGGTVKHDREFAFFDTEGTVVNGKRTDRVHKIDVDFDLEQRKLLVERTDGECRQFDLETDRQAATEWFSNAFETDLTLRRDESLGFVDRREMGPSVVSTATVETVASWFDGMTVESARRRLRANIEIAGVPAFWEDRFVGDAAPEFEINGIRFEGVTPCGRCVVPQRDPDTGEPTADFRERFIRNRRGTFPEWADADAFDHYYSLMIITHVSESDRGQPISLGDDVEIVE